MGGLCGCMCVAGEWVCVWVCINKKTINMSMTTYIFFNDVNTIAKYMTTCHRINPLLIKCFNIQRKLTMQVYI